VIFVALAMLPAVLLANNTKCITAFAASLTNRVPD